MPLWRESGNTIAAAMFSGYDAIFANGCQGGEVAVQPNAMVFVGEAQRTDASNRRSQLCQETGTTLPSGISRETPVLPDDFVLSATAGNLQERLQWISLSLDPLDSCQHQLQQDQDCLWLAPERFSCPASATLRACSSCS